ncbi:MAG: tetratricopeptide repeat protein [Phycisphaeraceae bacterium]|nr:tetratricopeptide repeat protein [Phycisphaeraceae bacterium]
MPPTPTTLADSAVAAASSDPKGDLDQARRDIAQALAAAPTDLHILFLAFQFYFRSGDTDTAERLAHRRLDLAPPDSAHAARALANLGVLAHHLARLDEAESHLTRALDIDRRLGNQEGTARALANLALVPESRGDLDRAESLYLESIAIAERLDGPAPQKIIAGALANLGDIAQARSLPDKARDLWTRSAAIFDHLGVTMWRKDFERRWSELDRSDLS